MSHDDVSGLILAGGGSRRFGTDKAQYPVAGRRMIRRVYDALVPLVQTVYVSVRSSDQTVHLPAVERVVDRYADAGPLAGLHAGLHAASTPWVLVVACDLPFLTTSVLHRLIAARPDAARPVVARTPDDRWQPLCACYPTSAVAVAEELLRQERYALRELLRALEPVQFVDVPADPLRNVNYKEDLKGE